MLDHKTINKIEAFVYTKPRSIQEIASHLNKNWRTADRYIEKIIKDYGTINSRIFREGTRGALKIIYPSQTDKISHTVFQEDMEKKIFQGRFKEDFYPFDIYQYVPDNKKSIAVHLGKDEEAIGKLTDFAKELKKAKKQIIYFSGNLSFINFKDKNTNFYDILEQKVREGINIKIITRIDLSGIENIKKMLSLNHKYGREAIEIRHREQPLRATIIDNNLLNLKEIRIPTGRKKELEKKHIIFYNIKDKEWIEWTTKIFWNMYNKAIGSKKRLEEIEKIRITKTN